MKCYEATYEKNGSNPETKLVAAASMVHAAKKAADVDEKLELVKLELTDKIII